MVELKAKGLIFSKNGPYIAQRGSADLMSGVACATPVTPPHTIGTSDARLPVGEWLPRADGTSRQETPGT